MSEILKMTKRELLALPDRQWGQQGVYDSLLVVSTGRKHDSGWACIAIIGVNDNKPVEVATRCSDDIEWVYPSPRCYDHCKIGQVRTDCSTKSGALHFWTRNGKFHVGCALSSITVELVPAGEAANVPER